MIQQRRQQRPGKSVSGRSYLNASVAQLAYLAYGNRAVYNYKNRGIMLKTNILVYYFSKAPELQQDVRLAQLGNLDKNEARA